MTKTNGTYFYSFVEFLKRVKTVNCINDFLMDVSIQVLYKTECLLNEIF